MTRVEATGHYHLTIHELRGAIQKRDAIVDVIRQRLQFVKSRSLNEVMDFDDNSFTHACSALNTAQKEVRKLAARVNEVAGVAEMESITVININIIGVI